MKLKHFKLYWQFIILYLVVLKLQSFAKAEHEFYSNTTSVSNDSFLWEHLKLETAKPIDKNLSFINDSYTLKKTAIHATFIRFESTSLFLSNAIVIGSKILAGGKMDYSVFIENSVFKNSQIVIDSASNVTIVHSHFIMENIRKEEEPNHVIKVYSTWILYMTDTHFGNQSIQDNQRGTGYYEMKNSTNLGINLENVLIAELRGCTFAGIKAGNSNGSAMLLKNTEILMISCQLYLNMANNGVIFGNNSVNITSRNTSFLSNYATESGAVFYLINSCSLINNGSIFQNNSAREYAGVVFAMYHVTINNQGCSFQHNSAETGGGSVIFMQYNCQLINKQVSFHDFSNNIMCNKVRPHKCEHMVEQSNGWAFGLYLCYPQTIS